MALMIFQTVIWYNESYWSWVFLKIYLRFSLVYISLLYYFFVWIIYGLYRSNDIAVINRVSQFGCWKTSPSVWCHSIVRYWGLIKSFFLSYHKYLYSLLFLSITLSFSYNTTILYLYLFFVILFFFITHIHLLLHLQTFFAFCSALSYQYPLHSRLTTLIYFYSFLSLFNNCLVVRQCFHTLTFLRVLWPLWTFSPQLLSVYTSTYL